MNYRIRTGGEKMKRIWNAIVNDLWVVLLDIVAVNAAYFLALAIRFYVNSQLRPVALNEYLPALFGYAPFYTIICIAVFSFFRLYGGMWRYAGINDMNRIIISNFCTFVLQVCGSCLFFARMPLTYYVIGGVLQLGFIIAIRFGYRVFLVEKKKIVNRGTRSLGVLIVGAGELASRVIKDLEESSAYKPVCIIDSGNEKKGRMIDGIPIVNGLDDIESAIEKYKIQNIIIADNELSTMQRNTIWALCESKGLEIQDFTGILSNQDDLVSVTALLELTNCPLLIRTDDEDIEFENSRQALLELTDRYSINSITIENGKLVLELRKSQQVSFSLDDDQAVAYVGYDAWSKRNDRET